MSRLKAVWSVLGVLVVMVSSCVSVAAPPARTVTRPLLLAHFMPWYQAPPVSSTYGWHWHMGFYDPFAVDAEGRRPLATHDPPLIGPYDSSDPRVIEYQLLTMKAAGIDGVILDWYGIEDVFDYAAVHRASQAVVAAVKKAGMTFAVCWEDQSIGKAVQARKYGPDQALTQGTAAIAWLEEHWFQDPAYLKFDGRPVLLDFGPQTFLKASDWQTLFSVTSVKPWFVSLENHLEHDADGFYNWPDMAASHGGTLEPEVLANQLNRFYAATKTSSRLVASAWLGFHDIYQQAGVAASYGYLDAQGGETFRTLLRRAYEARPDVIQLATWNDYGEGTSLEPNFTRGYDPLEDVQKLRRQFDPSFSFGPSDLRLPFELYKRRLDPNASSPQLDALADALFASDTEKARAVAAAFTGKAELPRSPVPVPAPAKAESVPPKVVNFAYGKPAQSTGHADVYTADKATDGELLTYWEGPGHSYPNDWWVDLRAPRAVTQVVLKLNPRRIWAARTQTIEVLAGPSREEQTTVVAPREYRFDPATGGNSVVIPLVGTYQVLTLRFTSNSEANAGQVAEVEVQGN